MRALAALVVYLNHAYAEVWNPQYGQAAPGYLHPMMYSLVAGHLSVTIFIVISGFCLTLPVVRAGDRLRGGIAAFFQRRARRILPPYYGAVALSLGLIATVLGQRTGTIWDAPLRLSAEGIVSHLLLLQDLFGTGSINYVFWSIAVEWKIYFLFPLLVWAWGRLGPRSTVLLALAAGYALRIGFGATRIERACPQYIGMFSLGMLAAYVVSSERPEYVRLRAARFWPWLAGVAFVAVCTLTKLWGVSASTLRFHVLDFPVGVLGACILVMSSRARSGVLARALSWKPLVAVGTFSYSLYLIHAPMLQLLWQYVLRPASLEPAAMFGFLMTAGLLIVLLASYVFYLGLEKPFMRSAGRVEKAPSEAAPVRAA
jgi:peptidoglycan/LPS O-acetylase OafA/YrhL